MSLIVNTNSLQQASNYARQTASSVFMIMFSVRQTGSNLSYEILNRQGIGNSIASLTNRLDALDKRVNAIADHLTMTAEQYSAVERQLYISVVSLVGTKNNLGLKLLLDSLVKQGVDDLLPLFLNLLHQVGERAKVVQENGIRPNPKIYRNYVGIGVRTKTNNMSKRKGYNPRIAPSIDLRARNVPPRRPIKNNNTKSRLTVKDVLSQIGGSFFGLDKPISVIDNVGEVASGEISISRGVVETLSEISIGTVLSKGIAGICAIALGPSAVPVASGVGFIGGLILEDKTKELTEKVCGEEKGFIELVSDGMIDSAAIFGETWMSLCSAGSDFVTRKEKNLWVTLKRGFEPLLRDHNIGCNNRWGRYPKQRVPGGGGGGGGA